MTVEADHYVSPLAHFRTWRGAAIEAGEAAVHDAVLATSSADGEPSARVITIKDVTDDALIFSTHLLTRKARDLAANPRCTLTCWWPQVRRQVRLTCRVEPVDDQQRDDLFRERARSHQLATIVSPQGQPIDDLATVVNAAALLDATNDGDLAVPDHFGGFRAIPHTVEFWQQADDRLHTRIEFAISADGWTRRMLAP